ncbi:MAG: energy transducer TonB, partial [Flavobacteriia bacterium]|nr:energy transducer TonB [Flavobacteriia bacterium]
MELKKNPNADLEKSRGMFLLLGLVLSLGIAIGAIEYRTYESGPMDLGQL